MITPNRHICAVLALCSARFNQKYFGAQPKVAMHLKMLNENVRPLTVCSCIIAMNKINALRKSDSMVLSSCIRRTRKLLAAMMFVVMVACAAKTMSGPTLDAPCVREKYIWIIN